MTKNYKKRPVVIQAVKYTGRNIKEIEHFCGHKNIGYAPARGQHYIITLEGCHYISIGDYIIKGVHGEFYPCKPDIFAKTYEEV